MRRIIGICLLMCLPLHGFAMQWGALLGGGDTTIAHQIEHDEHVAHHHHDDDGSVHYDDSGESADHMLDHPASPQPVHIAMPVIPVAPEQLVSSVVADAATRIPDPLLECPHRPPANALG